MLRRGAVAVIAMLWAPSATGQTEIGGLPRLAFLGTLVAPAADGRPMVRSVVPGSTAASVRVAQGDVVVAINGKSTSDVPALLAIAGGIRAGAPMTFQVSRGSKLLTLTGVAKGRELERYPGAKVTYGSFAFQGGRIRDILAMPSSAANAPVVFLLSGFTCLSIEPPSPTAAYRVLAARLTAAGIGFYRAEKPGLGDSLGGPQCADITFETELDAYRTAYRHLTDDLHIPRERIVLLGHSLGALEAPLLADERAPLGVAVYGVVLRNWGDYHQQLGSFQKYLIDGSDPGKTFAEGEQARPILEAFYFQKKSPDEIARDHPERAQTVKEVLDWDGKDRTIGRNWRFLQGLAALNLPAAWRDAKTNVLSFYGGADLVAMFDTDQKMIADIANFSRPGSGTYVEVPSADHGMLNVGSRDHAREDLIAQRRTTPVFDEGVATTLIGWVQSIVAKLPVGRPA